MKRWNSTSIMFKVEEYHVWFTVPLLTQKNAKGFLKTKFNLLPLNLLN